MPTVISFINLKGGVGKTTLAMQIALAADRRNLRTLAVDLDPQSNLSQALLGAAKYRNHLRENKPTIVQLFEGYVPAGGLAAPQPMELEAIILKSVGFSRDSVLDLIPSRLELCRTLRQPTGKERKLAKAIAKVAKAYDVILIDCAPTDSILTDAAYFASRFVVVPIKPEFMATIGLPLLARSLEAFKKENEDHQVDVAGLVFVHSSSYTSGPEGRKAIAEVREFARGETWPVFSNQIQYSATYAKAAREGRSIRHTSYARSKTVEAFDLFESEFFEQLKLVSTGR